MCIVDRDLLGSGIAYFYNNEFRHSTREFLWGLAVGLKYGLIEAGFQKGEATNLLLHHNVYPLHPDASPLISQAEDDNMIQSLKSQKYPHDTGRGILIGWVTASLAAKFRDTTSFSQTRDHIVGIIGEDVWRNYTVASWHTQ